MLMPASLREELKAIKSFDQLVPYLRDRMGWPIAKYDFKDLTFEYSPKELGIDARNAAKIKEIKRLRPLKPNQSWGIFFVKFERKHLPVVALRRILRQVTLKKRASANNPERKAWARDDLLFVSSYGKGKEQQLSFAHFTSPKSGRGVPTLKVLGWDGLDTPLKLEDVAEKLTSCLAWPEDDSDVNAWREQWQSAFTLDHQEVITTSTQLSVRLAELARKIRDHIKTALKIETENGLLRKLFRAFQTSLVHELDDDGFADMYAQTIAYGLLSMRITAPEKKTVADFANHMWTTPFLKEMLENFIKAGGLIEGGGAQELDYDELGVSEIVELLNQANMEAVVKDFGNRNQHEDPIIHFYEHFLEAYDHKQKVRRGVFYTPRPVVSYIVQSMDELLRTKFGLIDGLADTVTWGEMMMKHKDLKLPEDTKPSQAFIKILDPATGTGTFLVEVIDFIFNTMVKKWKIEGHNEAEVVKLWNKYVPKHLLPRLHGFELMMAPYSIAHLKIGLKLYETGYQFGSDERAHVYLTNSLEPAPEKERQQTLPEFLPALARESRAVNEIKRDSRFTVVIGNPPYSRFGRLNRIQYILDLLEDYKRNLGEKNINHLNDDFIKFMRFAHVRIEESGIGIIGMITNNVYVDRITHRRMREILHKTFPCIRILDLHGKTGKKVVPDGGTKDENIFDINQVGVAISMLCRGPEANKTKPTVSFNEILGLRTVKLKRLMENKICYNVVKPSAPYYFFAPKDFSLSAEYEMFVPLTEMFRTKSTGINTTCDSLSISFDRCEMLDRARFLLENDDETIFAKFNLPRNSRDWRLEWARNDLKRIDDLESHLRKVLYRPFDIRWTIYTNKSKGFLAYPRWKTMQHMLDDNLALIGMRQDSHVGATNMIMDLHAFCSDRAVTSLFPLYESPRENLETLALGERQHNLKQAFLKRVAVDDLNPEDAFKYAFAALSSLSYRTRYKGFLKIDYPRIPLPGSIDIFCKLARLGKELVDLHLMNSKALNHFFTKYSGPPKPEVSCVGWSDDTVWLDAGKTNARKGHQATVPGTIGFRCVPEEVWNLHIGGWHVCHKWLRERKGRHLTDEDIVHYQKIVVALSEIIRLTNEIDKEIDQCGGWPGAFVSK